MDIGYAWTQVPAGTFLPLARPTGVLCEQAMMQATNGVNTHKGAHRAPMVSRRLAACSALPRGGVPAAPRDGRRGSRGGKLLEISDVVWSASVIHLSASQPASLFAAWSARLIRSSG